MSQTQTLKNFLSVQKRGTTGIKDANTKKRDIAIVDTSISASPPNKKTRLSARLASKTTNKTTPVGENVESKKESTTEVPGGTQNIIDRILTRSRRKLVQPKLKSFLNTPELSAPKPEQAKALEDAQRLIKNNFSFDQIPNTQVDNDSEKKIESSSISLKVDTPKEALEQPTTESNSDTQGLPENNKKVPGYLKYRHLLQSSQSNENQPKSKETSKETTFASVNTTTKTAVPGYKKYGHLLAGKSELPLPDKFKTLEKIFHALHHTIVFFKSQNLNCVYHRMKKPVENMCNRTFSLDHLAQIKTVYPEAFTYEAIRYTHQGQRIDSILLEVSDSAEISYTDQSNIYENLKLAGSKLELRLKEFRRRLLSLVKAEHEKFLVSSSINVDFSNRTLLKWHPQFDLDSVSDIPKCELPKNDRPVISVVKSLKLDNSKSTEDKGVEAEVPSNGPEPTPHSNALAKASSLLDRIRAKEKRRNEDIMFGLSPEVLARKTILSRLPSIADSINFIFSSSKKTVLRQGEVVRKIIESYKIPLSEAEVVNHVKVASELAPDWIKLMPIGNSVMIKLDRTCLVKDVKDIFKAELQKISI
ncbi:hypothetical protein K7432_005245 [Basidiobolus ranarum]|uniref:CDT1 Geminin-binding domain-containing protein n=1 Tax=Basidiobolus ranarum TaxID=34480 RepID=A0ABR2W3F2_9FUNG